MAAAMVGDRVYKCVTLVDCGSSTEPAATKRGKGRPKHNIYDHERVCIEEPDYKEQDEASSTAPHPDTEEDQPVSVG